VRAPTLDTAEAGHSHAHGHEQGHGHGHADARPGAPKAPADVLAYLDGQPVPRRLLDERLADFRARDTACVLPKPDTREARQFARWVTQVILTEQLCLAELTRQGELTKPELVVGGGASPVQPAAAGVRPVAPGRTSTLPSPTSPEQPAARLLDVSAAIAVGSITAAALAGSDAVRRVAELVTSEVAIPAAQLAYAADVLGKAAPGDPAVPVERWHAELLDSARLEAFTRWLNGARFERVQLVNGLEHPGDSNQPDNLHRH
jgi:[acyl-carrier-protein] S-malonyltransferase